MKINSVLVNVLTFYKFIPFRIGPNSSIVSTLKMQENAPDENSLVKPAQMMFLLDIPPS